MPSVLIRRFVPADAPALESLIRRALLETNTRDYPRADMLRIATGYTADRLCDMAGESHLYTALLGGEIVGCGALSAHETHPGWAYVHAVFTHPGHQGQGVGRAVMQALENDRLFRAAGKVVLNASYTAAPFYRRLGWQPLPGTEAKGVVPMQKQPQEARSRDDEPQ